MAEEDNRLGQIGHPEIIMNKTFVPSMIHSARPTVPLVAITILTRDLFFLERF